MHLARGDLRAQGLIGAQQKLLSSLPASIEGARNLCAAEGAVGQQTTVFAGKGNSLRNALVDDRCADFRESVNICFTRAKISSLDRVIEETIRPVTVVLIVLGGIDSTLRSDRVGPACTVLVTEAFDVEALLAKGCRRRPSGETASDDDQLEFALVRGTDDLGVVLVGGPFAFQRTGRDVSFRGHLVTPLPRPKKRIEIGIETYPTKSTQAKMPAPVS